MTAPTMTLPVGDAAAAPAKKSNKKLIIIGAVVLLLVGAFGAKTFLMPKAKPGPPKPGAVVKMDDITMNLADNHYLRLGLALQLVEKVDATTIDGSAALDQANSLLAGRTEDSLDSAAAQDAVKKQLAKKIEALEVYKDKVMGVYFTDFVMQ
jgi:flagellar FliL protein